jgi:hypothetical protein
VKIEVALRVAVLVVERVGRAIHVPIWIIGLLTFDDRRVGATLDLPIAGYLYWERVGVGAGVAVGAGNCPRRGKGHHE